jgi:hypothetical protein
VGYLGLERTNVTKRDELKLDDYEFGMMRPGLTNSTRLIIICRYLEESNSLVDLIKLV